MSEARPDPFFIAGAPGLDFLNSIATPVDVPVEWIASGADLLDWLGKAGLVPAHALEQIRESALPGELDAIAVQARALREWFRGFVVAHRGRTIDASVLAQLEPLNRILKRDEQFSEIQAASRTAPLRLVAARRWQLPEALLFPIATAIAEVICGQDFPNIRACDGHNCTLYFTDRTRGHVRRWCSMAVCGNRAKQSAHRLRK
jgi:predicted RNA-binding Zn ribbon-like protein